MKKISLILLSLIALQSISTKTMDMAKDLATLSLAATTGYAALKTNEINRQPHLGYRADLIKLGCAAGALGALLLQQNKGVDVVLDRAFKLGSVAAIHFLLNNDTAGRILRPIPILGGLLADAEEFREEAQPRERAGIGRLARCVLGYQILRAAAMGAGFLLS